MEGCTHDTVRVRWIDGGYAGTCERCGAFAEAPSADPELGPVSVLELLGGAGSRWGLKEASPGPGRVWLRQ